MNFLNDKIKELESYLPPLTRRGNFDAFWQETLSQANQVPLNSMKQEASSPFANVRVYDITYNGYDNTAIHGWLLLPKGTGNSQIPCLIHYHGFGGNRGYPQDFAAWLLMGIAVLSVDCREQTGETGNNSPTCGGYTGNLACKGILDPYEYYFRAVYMDCIKAIDFIMTVQEIDPKRIIVEGGSQGGAMAMAVSGLDSRPALCLPEVPSNSNLERRVIGGHGSFSAVQEYLRLYPQRLEQVFETLSYFDIMNTAERIACPVLASVGLMDDVCPAECYFASFNRIKTEKYIKVYPFGIHECGKGIHFETMLYFVRERLL